MELINISEYEALAKQRMASAFWDYYQGGSNDEVSLRANRTAFEDIRLRPRVLMGTNTCDLHTTVLGTSVSMPILVAPTAQHGLAHPDGECATARGAEMAHTLMTVSTQSSYSIEDIARVGKALCWFQFYIYKDLHISESLLRRAEAAGYRAVVLTVDTPRIGRREKDIRNGFEIPPHIRFGNFPQNIDKSVLEEYAALNWDILSWIRTITSLPIILKGILTAEDAKLAIEHGVAGIIVSNHGGRRLDGSVATIEALPEIIDVVAGRCEVYLDGGIRRGTDALKALALGARAVLVGRPILWGLAVKGAEGVRHVLELLRSELELAMILAGQSDLESIDRSLVKIK